MEAPADLLYKQNTRSKCRRISLISVVVVAALLVLIIPLAIILPRKGRPHGLPSSVLLPLYIYPSPGAWDPLHEVLDSHPLLNFTVIINPEDGPGPSTEPSGDYVVALQNLTTYDNVRVLGYVRTHWATRNITEVMREVQIYSGWSKINSSASSPSPIAMEGIFFDEAPSLYSTQTFDYLQTINQAVKNATGLAGNRTVVHNPGTPPDARFESLDTDIIVAFEQSSDYYHSDKANITTLSLDRSRYSFMVHSAPAKDGSLKSLVASMSQRAQYLFATKLTSDYYESFSKDWTSGTHSVRIVHTALQPKNVRGRLLFLCMGEVLPDLALFPSQQSTNEPVPHRMQKTTVVVPLYIYPLPSAWEPLYEGITNISPWKWKCSILSHPHISFIIILNPHNGPGMDSSLPDATYSIEIPKLNAFPNVTTVGYVRIDYCRRPLESVKEDIAKYAHWSTVDGLGVHGIFFDETPNLYSPDVVKYLTEMNQIVKTEQGIVGDRFIIHNPGTIPDPDLASELTDQAPDLTAVVEDSYANYVSAPLQERLATLCRPPHFARHNTCYIVHSVPRKSQAQLVKYLSHRAAYLFLTDRCSRFYEGFGQGWIELLDTVGSAR
ncbi:hypothetical protein DV736_g4461, partial [Chaetothyriales sp. CBS 134916]